MKYTLTYNSHYAYDFDSRGDILKATNDATQVITYGYDTSFRLSTITNTEGQVTTFTYDASNRISTVNDPFGRTWRFTYDGNGNLAQIDAPGPMAPVRGDTHFSYDGSHNLTQIVDPVGDKTLVSGSTITRVTNPGNNSGPSWNAVTDGDGHVTKYTFDANGAPLTMTDPEGHVTKLTYTADEKVAQSTLPLDQVTKDTYDTYNDLTRSQLPSGASTSATYTNYNPTALTDEQGHTTTLVYGTPDYPVKVVDPLGYKDLTRLSGHPEARGQGTPEGCCHAEESSPVSRAFSAGATQGLPRPGREHEEVRRRIPPYVSPCAPDEDALHHAHYGSVGTAAPSLSSLSLSNHRGFGVIDLLLLTGGELRGIPGEAHQPGCVSKARVVGTETELQSLRRYLLLLSVTRRTGYVREYLATR